MLKQIHAWIACAALLACTAAGGAQIRVFVNDQPVVFQGMGPAEVHGRVMVPLRGVLEKLGAFVDWDPATQMVTASRGNLDLQMTLGSRDARVNGHDVTLDVPAMTMGGRTMVPLRFVGEALGAEVRWDGVSRTVLISTGQVHETIVVPPPTPVGPPPVRELEIVSATHTREGQWLHAGDTVRITVHATPGAHARFHIPGLITDAPLNETTPGIYEGRWTAPTERQIFVDGAPILVDMVEGGRTVGPHRVGEPLLVDTAPPVVEEMRPEPHAVVRGAEPLIWAAYSDSGGSGIATAEVRLQLDGRDVTPDSTVAEEYVSYSPPRLLTAGPHTVTLDVPDRAGNTAHASWTFDVEAIPSGIRSVVVEDSGTLGPGDVLRVQASGTPGGSASFDWAGIRNRRMVEETPGSYVGSYTVRPGDNIWQAPVVVTLVTPDGRRFVQTTPRVIAARPGPPPAPAILYPPRESRVMEPLTVRGTAQPNTIVRVRVVYRAREPGGLTMEGTVAQQDVPVDSAGHWQSRPMSVVWLIDPGRVDYTITAVDINRARQSSPAVLLPLR